MTPQEAVARVRALVGGGFDLPDPGGGATPTRWRALFLAARHEDVSVARLVEAHVDAVSILHEAGTTPVADAVYGVWASVGPGGRDVAVDDGTGGSQPTISGRKPFCSGAGVIDRALVDVHDGERRRMYDVDVSPAPSAQVSSGPTDWGTTSLAATSTGAVTFDRHPIDPERAVGGPGWYLARPGFWHGATGPAACWAGAAAGLVERHSPGDDPHRLARHGALLSEVFVLESVLDSAGRRADARPDDALEARRTALSARSAVHDGALRLVEAFSRSAGPRGLTDDATAQRVADTLLYVRQFHADHDLVALARTGSS